MEQLSLGKRIYGEGTNHLSRNGGASIRNNTKKEESERNLQLNFHLKRCMMKTNQKGKQKKILCFAFAKRKERVAMKKKKGLIAEFKEFISRGSVIDLAVGVIIGSAFTAIVNSLVNDVIMPIIGIILGKIKFTDLKLVITPASGEIAEVAVYYGNFIQSVVNFLLIAVVIFLMVKAINRIHRKKDEPAEEPAAEPEPSEETLLLREIRDLMKQQENQEK